MWMMTTVGLMLENENDWWGDKEWNPMAME
jgi:hypothetical protein